MGSRQTTFKPADFLLGHSCLCIVFSIHLGHHPCPLAVTGVHNLAKWCAEQQEESSWWIGALEWGQVSRWLLCCREGHWGLEGWQSVHWQCPKELPGEKRLKFNGWGRLKNSIQKLLILGCEAKGSRVGAPAALGRWGVGNYSVTLHTDAIHSSLAAARGSHSPPTGTVCARQGPGLTFVHPCLCTTIWAVERAESSAPLVVDVEKPLMCHVLCSLMHKDDLWMPN